MEDNGELWLFITIARQFHHGMMDKVLDNGDKSDSFPVTNGVKQGCFLALTLFSMVFSAMLTDAFWQDGISVRYRTDGGYPTSGGRGLLQKVKETVIRDFMFSGLCPQRQHRANDAAINRLLVSRQ